MGCTVFANERGIDHEDSGGLTPVFPDVCKTPTPGGGAHPVSERGSSAPARVPAKPRANSASFGVGPEPSASTSTLSRGRAGSRHRHVVLPEPRRLARWAIEVERGHRAQRSPAVVGVQILAGSDRSLHGPISGLAVTLDVWRLQPEAPSASTESARCPSRICRLLRRNSMRSVSSF
jgi:hypothetical protein